MGYAGVAGVHEWIVLQRRAVAARPRQLEERMAAARDLIDRDERGIMYRQDRPRVSAEQRARIDSLMAEVHAEIAILAETFRFASEVQDAARSMAGLLAITWQSLGEIRSTSLAGHGDIDRGLRDTLDPSVNRLMDLVLALEKEAAAGS